MVGSYRGLSPVHVLWAVLKSLIFSYLVGVLLLNVAVRIFGRIIGIRKIYRVGVLRYFVVLGCLSVAMGSALVYSEQPDYPAIQTSELSNSQMEQWQAVKDAKVYCAKQGKTMLLQKLDKAKFSATFTCL
jgi:thiol:disulfide interchange protein